MFTTRRLGLLSLPRRVSAAVLAKVDLELPVIILSTNSLNGLDGIGNVGKINKGTALFAESVDELNLTKLGKVLPETLLSPGLVKVTDIDISGSTTANGQSDGRRQSTGVLAPANLEAPVVDHETLYVAESVEGCSGGWVDERHEADVLVGNVADVVQQTTSDNIADLLDRSLGVNVAQIDGSVAKVVDTTSGGGNGGSSNRLLGQGIRNEITVSSGEHVSIARSDAQILGSILLLRLGNISTSILAVVHAAGCLPLGLLGKLRDSLDGIGNGQVVDESDVLLPDEFDGINGAELAQVLAKLLLGDLLCKVAQIDVSRGTRLLDSKGDRCGDLRWLTPANLDILTLDAELFQDGVRVEVGSGTGIKERDESAVLVGQEADRLDLAASNMAKNLLGRRVWGDVTQVDGSAGSSNNIGAHGNRRSGRKRCLHVKSAGRRLRGVELRSSISGGRDHVLVRLRRDGLLNRACQAILLLLVDVLLILLETRKALELGASKCGRGTRLEWAAEQKLRRQEGGELHVKGSARGGHVRTIVNGLLVHGLGVEGRDVTPSRVSVSKA